MACNPDNIGSKKSIINNGGVFEDKIISKYDGERLERYWIDIKQSMRGTKILFLIAST